MTATGATRRFGFTAFAAALVALAALVAMSASTPADAGAAAKRGACNISGQEDSFNTSYVGYIKTRNVRCGTAKEVIRSFHKCRHRRGGANGHCKREVKGFKCREERYNKSPYQYNSRVKCRKGDGRIRSQYTQNT